LPRIPLSREAPWERKDGMKKVERGERRLCAFPGNSISRRGPLSFRCKYIRQSDEEPKLLPTWITVPPEPDHALELSSYI